MILLIQSDHITMMMMMMMMMMMRDLKEIFTNNSNVLRTLRPSNDDQG
jgi:hypothetical protein